MAALKAGRRRSPMYGLVDIDVTTARDVIGSSAADLSVTAFIVASVARAAARHPNVHAYRDWRGRLITHEHVDVATMVEIDTREGKFPLALVVKDADVRSVASITEQLRTTKREPTKGTNRRFLRPAAMALARIPLLATNLFRLGGHSKQVRQRMGTLSVTALGMFGGGSGYGFGGSSVYSLGIVVGGLSKQPRIMDGNVVERDILNLTITVDHNMVDGAPAARFAADLRETIQSGAVLAA